MQFNGNKASNERPVDINTPWTTGQAMEALKLTMIPTI
jgi:hypothetical protein